MWFIKSVTAFKEHSAELVVKANKTIFALLIFFPLNQLVFSQQPYSNQKISVNYKNEALKEVLNDISQKSGTRFSYNPKIIPLDTLITFKAVNLYIDDVLKAVFKQTNIEYEYIEKHVVLRPSTPEEIIKKKEPAKQRFYTISGFIIDAASNEALIGATVYNPKTNLGATTNNYGYFSITLPEGEYNMETSYLGYAIESQTIQLNKNYKWNINLEQSVAFVDEIVVSSNNREAEIFSSLAAQTIVKPFEVKKQTAVLGETDMLKSFDNLPGVSFQGDGSSYFYVRGGNRDQNLILLDEAPIYNPSHMLGLFTPIIPDAVKTTSIYKADFPIQYGGRLSSLIDIRTRDGNMERFSGSASLGLVSSRFSIEGPIKKNRSSYFISFRRSYFGAIFKSIQPSIKDFYFTDFTAKLNFKLGQKDRLFITLYHGKDKFINEETVSNVNGLEWGNNSVTLRWNHVFGEKLFSNTTFYSSQYNYYLHTDYNKNYYWNSHISSLHVKTEFNWYINPKNQIKYGVKFGSYYFNPGNHNAPGIEINNTVSPVNSNELVVYAGNELQLTNKILFNYGLRFTNWSNYGEAFIVSYENYNPVDYTLYAEGEKYYSKSLIEPRLSLSLKTGIYSSVKASYNRTLQNINLINNSISPFNTLEVWIPAGPNIKPQKADIYNLGYIQAWPNKSVEFNVDIFYKQLFNQIGYSYHANTLLNPMLEGELRQGKGTAYGFEILVKKTQGRFTGQLGYSFTRSLLKIDGLNNNREYKARQDKPIDFSVGLGYNIKPRWLGTFNFVYASGLMITTPTSFYYYRGTQVPVYTEQNNSRLPDYKRFDISSDFKLNKSDGNFEHHLVISLYNFFATKNAAFLYFTKTKNSDGNYIIPMDKQNLQNQIVTQRYIFSIIPSITYTLKF